LGVYIGIAGFFRDKNSLAKTIAITDINKDKFPMVAPRAYPAAESHFFTDIIRV
jgi:hypothetical protein